jgi:type IV secretory pathway TrbD component
MAIGALCAVLMGLFLAALAFVLAIWLVAKGFNATPSMQREPSMRTLVDRSAPRCPHFEDPSTSVT